MNPFTRNTGRVEELDEDRIVIVREQDITKEFLDELHSERLAKAHMRSGELDRVASVPTSLVDLWLAQGFPFHSMSPREIVAKLRADGLDAFITTSKAV